MQKLRRYVAVFLRLVFSFFLLTLDTLSSCVQLFWLTLVPQHPHRNPT